MVAVASDTPVVEVAFSGTRDLEGGTEGLVKLEISSALARLSRTCHRVTRYVGAYLAGIPSLRARLAKQSPAAELSRTGATLPRNRRVPGSARWGLGPPESWCSVAMRASNARLSGSNVAESYTVVGEPARNTSE